MVGPLGPDHALARRDGQRREGDGAARPRPAAPDRGCDDLEAAHRRPDRSRLLAADRVRARRLAGRRHGGEPARPGRAGEFDRENRELQERLREQHAERDRKPLLHDRRCAGQPRTGSPSTIVPPPPFTGARLVEPDLEVAARVRRLAVLLPRLGAEGQVPGDPRARRRRSELYDDALALLDEIVGRTARSHARGVYGFWPACSDGDDVVLEDGTRFCFLRQQSDYGDSRPNRCLADYVAPQGDALGAFAVGIHGADELAARYEAEHDDYRLDHGQGARRPARGGVRRVAARRGQARLVRARRDALERGPGRRALPRDPARLRVSGKPRTTARRRSCSSCWAPRKPGSS